MFNSRRHVLISVERYVDQSRSSFIMPSLNDNVARPIDLHRHMKPFGPDMFI